ncbi:cyclic nucleotide-binding domain-containing protein [Gemmata sp.]|uniref:cyclic nucleotide-binding domain-containing protein n=1 Tax=Gemmata sp. TaxID=1914242 RepID=UPI003F725ED6
MTDSVTPAFLKTLAFFAPATDEELQLLVPAAQVEQYPAGATIFREGDHLSHVFIVTAGTVALEVTGHDHNAHRVQTVSTGELLGWSPVLGPGPMTATAHAATLVRVVALDAGVLVNLCTADPRFGYHFMRRTAAALAARLSATRLHLLDAPGHAARHAGARW